MGRHNGGTRSKGGNLAVGAALTNKQKGKIRPGAPKGSDAEILNSLLSAHDSDTGALSVRLVAGRPDWDSEFGRLRGLHRKEKVGVVFCGAPMIAAALKDVCEKHSDAQEGTADIARSPSSLPAVKDSRGCRVSWDL